jgi:hypothetical protein
MNKLTIPHDALVFVGDGRKKLFLRNDGNAKAGHRSQRRWKWSGFSALVFCEPVSEVQMRQSNGKVISRAASPPRNSRNSPSEQTDEAPGLIDKEQVEVEREIPADDNQPIEGIEPRDRPEPPAFED